MSDSQQDTNKSSGTSSASTSTPAENLGRSRVDLALWNDAAGEVLNGNVDTTVAPPPTIR